MSGTTAIANNTTYFAVYEIQYLTTGDIINMYVNPTPGVPPASPTATLTLAATNQLTATTTVKLWHEETSSVATFDELRLGVSYAAVAPDPLVPTPSSYPTIATQTTPLTLPSSTHTPLTFSPTLATSIPTATLDLSWHTPTSDYHLYNDDTTPSDSFDPTLDPLNELVLNI